MLQLQPSVKNYDWGMPAGTSMAPFFVAAENHDKIAELWWGHPHVVVRDSQETIQTRFLLKLLFVGKPLSLQAHPTPGQIQQHPSSFCDPLPKPEVVVALTDFEALCGFLSTEKVQDRISPIPLLASYPSFHSLFQQPLPELDLLLASVRDYALRFHGQPHCRVFLSLLGLYPSGDPAVLCPFYMNYVSLRRGQALVIPASQPHCYLSGQGVECMPPSDNVVRCGLTSKPCDLPLFFQITAPSPQEVVVKNYPYDHPELTPYFSLFVPHQFCFCRKGSILLVLEGEGEVEGKNLQKGGSWILQEEKTIHVPENLHILIAMPQT